MCKKRIVFTVLSAALLSVLCFWGCSTQEPIVREWETTDPAALERYYDDGTFTYTNSYFTELDVLKGTWERGGGIPEAIEVEGKPLVTMAGDEIVGEGESGNKYKYNTNHPDYYYLVNGDEKRLVISRNTLDDINDEGKFDGIESVSYRVK